jgi:hypothetical protein
MAPERRYATARRLPELKTGDCEVLAEHGSHPRQPEQGGSNETERMNHETTPMHHAKTVGATGFEPATSCTPSTRANPGCATPRIKWFVHDSLPFLPTQAERSLELADARRCGGVVEAPAARAARESAGGVTGEKCGALSAVRWTDRIPLCRKRLAGAPLAQLDRASVYGTEG